MQRPSERPTPLPVDELAMLGAAAAQRPDFIQIL
jgi:hypothetical protein